MKGKTTILSFIIIFMILNVLDLALTVSAVENGKGHEANPAMAYLLENSTLMFAAVKIVAGLVVALLIYKLRHVKVARITALLIIAAYLVIVANNAVVSATVVGSNVVAVGAGYSYLNTGNPEFLYADSNNIYLVEIDQNGNFIAEYTLITNVSNVKSITVGSDGHIYFSKSGGIWRREVTSTNPLDFSQLKDDPNYFKQITSIAGRDLSPTGNRIYFYSGLTIYYIENGATISQLVSTPGIELSEISVNENYIYAFVRYGSGDNYNLHIILYDHNGNLIQNFDSNRYIGGYTVALMSMEKVYVVVKASDYDYQTRVYNLTNDGLINTLITVNNPFTKKIHVMLQK